MGLDHRGLDKLILHCRKPLDSFLDPINLQKSRDVTSSKWNFCSNAIWDVTTMSMTQSLLSSRPHWRQTKHRH